MKEIESHRQIENHEEKQVARFLVVYLLFLFLCQFLVNDVWIAWENAHISTESLGSWIWAFIKFAYWCLPILVYAFILDKALLSHFNCLYTLHIKQLYLLAVIPLWGFLILLPNFKIPVSDYNYIVNGVIATPLIEEFVFRGFILNELTRRFTFGKANIVQSMLFSLNHLPWLYALGLFHSPITLFSRLLFYVVFGVMSGYLVKNTKSIVPSMLFHAVNNILAMH